mmetsp:Transcript_19832/g.45245  ORF Transcript_19832/g.45245 Transcript_19832/m.45245 type:complete len:294 (+) Transcript_19832:1363-2244(+)
MDGSPSVIDPVDSDEEGTALAEFFFAAESGVVGGDDIVASLSLMLSLLLLLFVKGTRMLSESSVPCSVTKRSARISYIRSFMARRWKTECLDGNSLPSYLFLFASSNIYLGLMLVVVAVAFSVLEALLLSFATFSFSSRLLSASNAFQVTSPSQSPPRPLRLWDCFRINPSTTGVTRQPPAPMSTTRAVWRPSEKAESMDAGAKKTLEASRDSISSSVYFMYCCRLVAAWKLWPVPPSEPVDAVYSEKPGVTASRGWRNLSNSPLSSLLFPVTVDDERPDALCSRFCCFLVRW